MQQLLDIGATQIDLKRFVNFTPDPFGSRWVSTEGSKRRGLKGKCIGILELRGARGYAVVLQLDDGRIDTFHPESLHPDLAATTTDT